VSTARDVIEMLRRHYLPEGRQPAGIFAPEIQAPTGLRRADLIWQGVTTAAGSELIGHEVKVSRQDLLVELADPAKADPWQRYCDRWWLVVSDPALIDGLTLPPSWGVMAPPSGRRTRSMTVLVEAPVLKPDDKALAYATIAKWLHWRHHNLDAQHRMTRAENDSLREANAKLRERVPLQSHAQEKIQQVVERIVRSLGGVTGSGQVGSWDRQVEVEDIVSAMRDLGTVYERARTVKFGVEAALGALRRATEAIRPEAIDDLAAAVEAIEKPCAEEAA
jgi:hypothetical protein